MDHKNPQTTDDIRNKVQKNVLWDILYGYLTVAGICEEYDCEQGLTHQNTRYMLPFLFN